MKTNLVVFFILLFSINSAFAQFTLGTPQKVCIDNMGITELNEILPCNQGFIVNTSKGGNKGGFVFYDPVAGVGQPTKDYRRFHYAFGMNNFGNNFYFAIDKSTYNDKTKTVNEKSTLYFSDPTGNLRDSIELNFSVISLPAILTSEVDKVPMIVQLQGKMLLVAVDIKTGIILKTIFTEKKTSMGTDMVPTAISVDRHAKYFACGTSNGDGGFTVYDYQSLEPIYTQKETSQILCIKFSSDSKYCFVQNIDTRTLTVIDCEARVVVKSQTFDMGFSHFSIHPNDEFIALSGGTKGIQLYNWNTDVTEVVNLNALTFQAEFSSDGNGIGVTSRGLDCMVNKDNQPYLSYLPVLGYTNGENNQLENTNQTNHDVTNTNNDMKYKLGERVLAYFPLTGERYSAIIKKVNESDYDVLYDDGQTTGTVTDLQIVSCPPLRVDEVVYAINKQGYLKWATVTKIDGDKIEVWYDNGGKEMTTRSKIIQVEH